MSGKQRFLYWRYILLLFILTAGCSPSQSDLSEGNPVTKPADAIAEEMSHAADIRVFNFISIDKNLVLYYYKVGRAEIEQLKHYWIKNNRVVLGGGGSSVINIAEDDRLTVSGYGFSNLGESGKEDWVWFVYGTMWRYNCSSTTSQSSRG